MKKRVTNGITLLCVLVCISCSSNHREYEAEVLSDVAMTEEKAEMETAADNQSGMQTALSSSAAVAGKQDSIRKFIRTAGIRFKAKNVVQAVYAIEDITNKQDGFVQYSGLKSILNREEKIILSKDSTLTLTHYTVNGELILRVPNRQLDATLKEIAQWVDYLDFRTVEANDVSLMLLRNQLTQKRENRTAERVENAVDNRGRKLQETIEGEETLSDKLQRADDALISNLSLKDKVEFSTITLSIYQDESIKKALVANERNIDAYQPGFGVRLLEALKWGGNAILEVVVFIANLWAFLMIAIIGFWVYKKWIARNKE
jgi:hypothetical protein